MHEMGIASSILEAVQKETDRYPDRWPAKVGVRIGKLAGVDPESLRFCFEALIKQTELERLELDVEWTGGDELDLAYLELEDADQEVVG